MMWKEVESRREKRRLKRLPAQGQRLGAMCNRAREVFSGIVGRRLRYPWAQVTTKDVRIGAEATDHLPRRQNSGTK